MSPRCVMCDCDDTTCIYNDNLLSFRALPFWGDIFKIFTHGRNRRTVLMVLVLQFYSVPPHARHLHLVKRFAIEIENTLRSTTLEYKLTSWPSSEFLERTGPFFLRFDAGAGCIEENFCGISLHPRSLFSLGPGPPTHEELRLCSPGCEASRPLFRPSASGHPRELLADRGRQLRE